MSERSRVIEDAGMVVAILLGVAYGVAESLARLGICIGKCTAYDSSIPWGLLIVMLFLVAPKTLGRSGATQLIGGLVGRLPLPGRSEPTPGSAKVTE